MTHNDLLEPFETILQFLTHIHVLGLKYSYKHGISPKVHVDTDLASDTSSLKSVNGMVTIIAGAAVLLYSRINEVTAVSSTEAEYMSLCPSTKETICTQKVFNDTGLAPNV